MQLIVVFLSGESQHKAQKDQTGTSNPFIECEKEIWLFSLHMFGKNSVLRIKIRESNVLKRVMMKHAYSLKGNIIKMVILCYKSAVHRPTA